MGKRRREKGKWEKKREKKSGGLLKLKQNKTKQNKTKQVSYNNNNYYSILLLIVLSRI